MIKIQIRDILEGTIVSDMASLLAIPRYFEADVFNKMNKIVPELVNLKNYLITVAIQLCEREGGVGSYKDGNFIYDFGNNVKAKSLFLTLAYNPMLDQYYYFDIEPLTFNDTVPQDIKTRLHCLTVEA